MDLLMESRWTGSAWFETGAPSSVMSPCKMVLDLAPALVQELTDAFRYFDRNGDGRISQDELGAVMCSLGQPVDAADVARLVRDVDTNGDGFIDLYEFIELNTRPMNAKMGCTDAADSSSSDEESGPDVDDVQDSALVAAFGVLDADKNGLISAEELQRVLVALGDETASVDECRHMIQCVDQDGDQMVDFREFQTLMSGTCAY